MYQLTAYCTPLGLREGHLIYAKGDTASHAIEVVGAGITIYCHAPRPDHTASGVAGLDRHAHRDYEGSKRR